MRAAEIRFFWYRAELFSLFSRLPRARCSRGAPFLFFPPPLDVRKRRAGLPKRRGSGTPPMNSNPFQKNRRVPKTSNSLSLVFVLKKFSTGKEPPERVFFRERRAHKVASQKEDAKRLFGGRGRVSNLRERASRLLGKEYKGRQTELQFFSFLEFRVLEKRFESLNVFQAFLSSSY
jgi:hypothetical protein